MDIVMHPLSSVRESVMLAMNHILTDITILHVLQSTIEKV